MPEVLALKAQRRHVMWIVSGVFRGIFGRKISHHVMDASCWSLALFLQGLKHTTQCIGNENSARSFFDRSFLNPLGVMDVRAFGSWMSAPKCLFFSRISRAWPKFLPPDVRRDIRVDIRGISGPKTYSLGCFFVPECKCGSPCAVGDQGLRGPTQHHKGAMQCLSHLHFIGESLRGNRLGATGLRASERKSASERVSEREGSQRFLRGFWEVSRGFQRFWEVFRGF